MTDAHDWARGKPRKKLDPDVCKRLRISEDRVWVVGLLMALELDASPFRLVWASNGSVAKKLGCSPSEVNDAVRVLRECGLLVPVDPRSYTYWDFRSKGKTKLPDATVKRIESGRSIVYRAGWTSSNDRSARREERAYCDAITASIGDLRGKSHEAGSGLYRTLRVAYTGALLGTWKTKDLNTYSGIPERAINKAKKVAGEPIGASRAVSEKPRKIARIHRNRPESPDNTNTNTSSTTTRTNFVSSIRSGFGRTEIPEQRTGSMGWSIFEDDVPSHDPAKTSPNSYLRNRKPFEQWTALDSAKEFRDRYNKLYARLPGETGNVVKISQILGKMRKDFGHGAEVEIKTLELWLANEDDVRRSPQIPAYRKWLASFQRLRPLVEEQLSAGVATYLTPTAFDTVPDLSEASNDFLDEWEDQQTRSWAEQKEASA